MEGKLTKYLSLRIWLSKGMFLHLSLPLLTSYFYSYGHHLGNWNALAKKAPRWAKFWQNEISKQILYVLCFYK
jgi:hypothetical protein